MRKNRRVRIAWMLICALLFTVIPADKIHAEESGEINLEKSIDMEEMFNYLYINQSEQQTGDEQMVVISLGDGSEYIQGMELTVKNEEGDSYVLQPEKSEEGIYLFKNSFSKGVYYIESVEVTVNDSQTMYIMSEMGIHAYFSVGTECPEEEKSAHIEVESVESTEPEVGMTVITLGEDGEESKQVSVEEALEAAGTAKTVNSNARAVKEDVVVVLDPGHDVTHAGASYFGLDEHILTLKIAKYCKEELEKYDGITVYLTRETEKCPYSSSKNNLEDIEKRVKWADTKGADAFVSIHLNASEASTPKGAEVYYHPSNSAGKNLSQKVQDELVGIGLYDREIQTNDKYMVIKTAQSCGFPGIIIEHAFMSNKTDSDKYLKTESGLKKLGVADATGIAKYYNLPKIGAKTEISEAVYTVSNISVEGKVLSSSGTELFLTDLEKHASQRFEVVSAENKYYYIVSEESGKVLGISDGKVNLQEKKEGNKEQKWAFLTAGSDSYYLRSESGKYLSVSEDTPIAEETKREDSQKWTLEKASYRSIEGLTPELVSVTNSNESVVVKWRELTGADGYYVYRKTANTKWTKVGTVESETTVSYTDSKAPANTKCFYTVSAYKGETESLFDENGLSVKTPEKKTYTNYRTNTSVNYRTGPGTSYSKAGTLASGKVISVEDGYSKKANGYTWYRFKMNSRNYYIASKYIQKVVVLAKPVVTSAKHSSGSITVKWKKVTNAKGYYVYRKVSGGSYSKIATVKSGSTLTYKDKTTVAGKKYTYTVKAYNGSDKSSYGNGISVTTPKESLIKYKTTTKVNYRSGAGTKYSVKGTLKKGKTVSVVKGWSKTANGMKWYKVKISGKYYYVAAKYLKKL